ncbi:unnamed protein product [Parnassius apollo]|uniref:(apollo) hypothetical protein n=1 Tax=Parnassius apollo TaxID=110799 RepID=A0A8S3W1S2_PARAO|nr:unnamed protein product [Parnassius apollo]
MPPEQSKQERLEKKRLAERRRLQKIKNDPELKAQLQEKERQKYLKKKIWEDYTSRCSPQQQKLARKKSRESSNRYNQKKKLRKIQDLEEIVNYSDKIDSEINSDNNEHPLILIPPHSSNSFTIESSPPPSPDSDIYAPPSRITRSTRRKNLDQTSIHQLGLELEPTSFSDTDTSSS